MTSNTSDEADAWSSGDRKRLLQHKSQRRSSEKASLPKWFEDSRNKQEHQAKYLGKIYQMREKLIQDEKRIMDHSYTRMDRQKFLSNRPMHGRPRAFTSPSLLDDVKGILISRRPDVRSHKVSSEALTEDLKKASGGKKQCQDDGSFNYKSADSTDMDVSDNTAVLKDDNVFVNLAKCKRGQSSCDRSLNFKVCRDESLIAEVAFEKKERKEFCGEVNSRSVVKRRESRKDIKAPSKRSTNREPLSDNDKKESISRLPKLKDIPRRRRTEAKVKNRKTSTRHSSSSSECSVNGMTMVGRQVPPQEQVSKSERDELFLKLDKIGGEDTKGGNSPTLISPRSISPHSLSGSPTSPLELKFPDPESSFPKVEITLPPVPPNSQHVTTSRFSLSAREGDDSFAPAIVLRPATPHVERIEQPVKPRLKGWSLWKAVKQTEIRRMELKKLIEDIKEFNNSNKSIEQRLSEVSTS